MSNQREGASAPSFTVKDSGQRIEYASGMRRDVQDGKTDFMLVRDGPMLERWAEHLTKGAEKYGRRNWQLANSTEELERFYSSAARHFEQWLRGDTDEDHAAAVFFNINAVEYVKERLERNMPELREEWDFDFFGGVQSPLESLPDSRASTGAGGQDEGEPGEVPVDAGIHARSEREADPTWLALLRGAQGFHHD